MAQVADMRTEIAAFLGHAANRVMVAKAAPVDPLAEGTLVPTLAAFVRTLSTLEALDSALEGPVGVSPGAWYPDAVGEATARCMDARVARMCAKRRAAFGALPADVVHNLSQVAAGLAEAEARQRTLNVDGELRVSVAKEVDEAAERMWTYVSALGSCYGLDAVEWVQRHGRAAVVQSQNIACSTSHRYVQGNSPMLDHPEVFEGAAAVGGKDTRTEAAAALEDHLQRQGRHLRRMHPEHGFGPYQPLAPLLRSALSATPEHAEDPLVHALCGVAGVLSVATGLVAAVAAEYPEDSPVRAGPYVEATQNPRKEGAGPFAQTHVPRARGRAAALSLRLADTNVPWVSRRTRGPTQRAKHGPERALVGWTQTGFGSYGAGAPAGTKGCSTRPIQTGVDSGIKPLSKEPTQGPTKTPKTTAIAEAALEFAREVATFNFSSDPVTGSALPGVNNVASEALTFMLSHKGSYPEGSGRDLFHKLCNSGASPLVAGFHWFKKDSGSNTRNKYLGSGAYQDLGTYFETIKTMVAQDVHDVINPVFQESDDTTKGKYWHAAVVIYEKLKNYNPLAKAMLVAGCRVAAFADHGSKSYRLLVDQSDHLFGTTAKDASVFDAISTKSSQANKAFTYVAVATVLLAATRCHRIMGGEVPVMANRSQLVASLQTAYAHTVCAACVDNSAPLQTNLADALSNVSKQWTAEDAQEVKELPPGVERISHVMLAEFKDTNDAFIAEFIGGEANAAAVGLAKSARNQWGCKFLTRKRIDEQLGDTHKRMYAAEKNRAEEAEERLKALVDVLQGKRAKLSLSVVTSAMVFSDVAANESVAENLAKYAIQSPTDRRANNNSNVQATVDGVEMVVGGSPEKNLQQWGWYYDTEAQAWARQEQVVFVTGVVLSAVALVVPSILRVSPLEVAPSAVSVLVPTFLRFVAGLDVGGVTAAATSVGSSAGLYWFNNAVSSSHWFDDPFSFPAMADMHTDLGNNTAANGACIGAAWNPCPFANVADPPSAQHDGTEYWSDPTNQNIVNTVGAEFNAVAGAVRSMNTTDLARTFTQDLSGDAAARTGVILARTDDASGNITSTTVGTEQKAVGESAATVRSIIANPQLSTSPEFEPFRKAVWGGLFADVVWNSVFEADRFKLALYEPEQMKLRIAALAGEYAASMDLPEAGRMEAWVREGADFIAAQMEQAAKLLHGVVVPGGGGEGLSSLPGTTRALVFGTTRNYQEFLQRTQPTEDEGYNEADRVNDLAPVNESAVLKHNRLVDLNATITKLTAAQNAQDLNDKEEPAGATVPFSGEYKVVPYDTTTMFRQRIENNQTQTGRLTDPIPVWVPAVGNLPLGVTMDGLKSHIKTALDNSGFHGFVQTLARMASSLPGENYEVQIAALIKSARARLDGIATECMQGYFGNFAINTFGNTYGYYSPSFDWFQPFVYTPCMRNFGSALLDTKLIEFFPNGTTLGRNNGDTVGKMSANFGDLLDDDPTKLHFKFTSAFRPNPATVPLEDLMLLPGPSEPKPYIIEKIDFRIPNLGLRTHLDVELSPNAAAIWNGTYAVEDTNKQQGAPEEGGLGLDAFSQKLVEAHDAAGAGNITGAVDILMDQNQHAQFLGNTTRGRVEDGVRFMYHPNETAADAKFDLDWVDAQNKPYPILTWVRGRLAEQISAKDAKQFAKDDEERSAKANAKKAAIKTRMESMRGTFNTPVPGARAATEWFQAAQAKGVARLKLGDTAAALLLVAGAAVAYYGGSTTNMAIPLIQAMALGSGETFQALAGLTALDMAWARMVRHTVSGSVHPVSAVAYVAMAWGARKLDWVGEIFKLVCFNRMLGYGADAVVELLKVLWGGSTPLAEIIQFGAFLATVGVFPSRAEDDKLARWQSFAVPAVLGFVGSIVGGLAGYDGMTSYFLLGVCITRMAYDRWRSVSADMAPLDLALAEIRQRDVTTMNIKKVIQAPHKTDATVVVIRMGGGANTVYACSTRGTFRSIADMVKSVGQNTGPWAKLDAGQQAVDWLKDLDHQGSQLMNVVIMKQGGNNWGVWEFAPSGKRDPRARPSLAFSYPMDDFAVYALSSGLTEPPGTWWQRFGNWIAENTRDADTAAAGQGPSAMLKYDVFETLKRWGASVAGGTVFVVAASFSLPDAMRDVAGTTVASMAVVLPVALVLTQMSAQNMRSSTGHVNWKAIGTLAAAVVVAYAGAWAGSSLLQQGSNSGFGLEPIGLQEVGERAGQEITGVADLVSGLWEAAGMAPPPPPPPANNPEGATMFNATATVFNEAVAVGREALEGVLDETIGDTTAKEAGRAVVQVFRRYLSSKLSWILPWEDSNEVKMKWLALEMGLITTIVSTVSGGLVKLLASVEFAPAVAASKWASTKGYAGIQKLFYALEILLRSAALAWSIRLATGLEVVPMVGLTGLVAALQHVRRSKAKEKPAAAESSEEDPTAAESSEVSRINQLAGVPRGRGTPAGVPRRRGDAVMEAPNPNGATSLRDLATLRVGPPDPVSSGAAGLRSICFPRAVLTLSCAGVR